MKDVMASLPEVINAYKGYNLLVPTATDVQLNPFYKFHVEEVPVDLSETSGDIFKVGSVDTGKKDDRGNKIYADVFSLSKPLLNKMAMAAGIQFNPDQTYGERIDRVTYRAHAQGAMRKADGTCRTETDQKEICLEDEEEKYRIEFSDKAVRGITDEKQAKAAAEIFKGTWVDATNKWGKKVKAYWPVQRTCIVTTVTERRNMERKSQVQISKDLLLALFQYHLAGNEEYLPEIEKALMEKLDSMVKRQLYTTFKTAPTEEEREKARQEYLDKCGMHKDFRW